MSKKKFAVLASGWNDQILKEYMDGMKRGVRDINADIYIFLCYPPASEYKLLCENEFNIFNLPDFKQFDGVVVMSSFINSNEVLDKIFTRCKKAGVPVISRGRRHEGTIYSNVDNGIGMHDLTEHLISVHGIKNPAFLAGNKDSEDSQARFESFLGTLKEHNIDFNEDYLSYTDWDNFKAINFVKELHQKNGSMPDAFVCSNDGLAMSVVLTLNDMGYDVPNDIIVTGFDYLSVSRRFYPAIASVDQQFEECGYQAALRLIQESDGNHSDEDLIIPCKFYPGESCGCMDARDSDAERRTAGRELPAKSNLDNWTDRILNTMEREIQSATSFQNLSEKLSFLIMEKHFLESNTLHILIDPSVINSSDNIEKRDKGYPSSMQVLFSMENGIISNATVCKTKCIIPSPTDQSKNQVYVALPLFSEERPIGYVVTKDILHLLKNRVIQKYQNRFNVALEKYWENINMTKLNGQLVQMVKIDALTNVKNRAAYDEASGLLQNQILQNPYINFAIVMFDINNLKKINDEYGHEAGDEYIVSSCRFICSVFSHSPVFRIGGDEFVTILTGEEYSKRKRLLENMRELMNTFNDNPNITITKRVSVASGYSDYIPKTDTSVADVFNRADQAMYENKIQMKGYAR